MAQSAQQPDDVDGLIAGARYTNRPGFFGPDEYIKPGWPSLVSAIASSLGISKSVRLVYSNGERALRLDDDLFRYQVDRTRTLLDRLGLKQGDTVAILDKSNHPDTLAIMLASWMNGVKAMPLNAKEAQNYVANAISKADCRVAFARDDCLELTDGLRLETLVCMGQNMGGCHYESALQGMRPRNDFLDIDPWSDALLIATAGTTGEPKLVRISHEGILYNASAIIDAVGAKASDTFMTSMPLFHVNAIIVSGLCSILSGSRLMLLDKWRPREYWSLLDGEKVTIASSVPAMLGTLMEMYGFNAVPVLERTPKAWFCGAGQLNTSLAEEWVRTVRIPITHCWGMSEATVRCTMLQPWTMPDDQYSKLITHNPPSIGSPLGCCRVGVMGDDGRMLGEGQEGELVVVGKTVMNGYLGDNAATVAAFEHGVLHSGDCGYYTVQDGTAYFFVTGRIKDIIERGGEKYSPASIEQYLARVPGVAEGVVVGIPDAKYGQEVAAVVRLQAGAVLSIDEVQACYKKNGVSWSKTPKALRVVEDFPRTATGKCQRGKLADLFKP
ncbi:acyl--CoA ligase [Candidatus Woesearchaeota archaeon]|nr:acyl--CoA ligase [Candidatus Woesearchaeota archaeon]